MEFYPEIYEIRFEDGKYQLVSPRGRVIIQSKKKEDIKEYCEQSGVEITDTTKKKKERRGNSYEK